MIPFSVLDFAPIVEGGDAAQSFRNTLDLAQHAERWDYNRYWLAEHHNIPSVASAATAVVIGYVAGGTSTIRVGAEDAIGNREVALLDFPTAVAGPLGILSDALLEWRHP